MGPSTMARTVTVKVGASIDSSFDRVFRTIESSAKRARVTVSSEMQSAGKQSASGIKDGLSKAERDYRAWADTVGAEGKRAFNPAIEAAQHFAAESKAKFAAAAADFKTYASVIESESRKLARDQAKHSLGIGEYSASARLGRIGGHARAVGAGLLGVAGFGGRILSDVAHGAGINTDLGSYIEKNQEIQSKSVQLSNSAYIPSERGPAGTRVDPKVLETEARKVANETAQNAGDALDGLIAFTEKTGDLDTGRKILKDMAVLSKATGSSMSDTVLAAAAVSNQLGDIPNKGKAAAEVMRVFAGQGQVGAIEIRNMATQMTKLAAQARNFHVNKETGALLSSHGVTTDIGQSIAVLGALSQASMQTGGRGTATTATNSAAAFVRDLSGKTATKRFKAAGIGIYDDATHTHQRDPVDIIRDILTKTQGKGDQITALMSNVNSRAPVMAFAAHYNAAREAARKAGPPPVMGADGKMHQPTHWASAKDEEQAENAAGLKAVTEKYNEFLDVTMSQQEIQDKFALAMQTSESQVTVFNNKMAEASAQIMDQLMPAMIQLAPAAVQLAGVFVESVGKLASLLGLDQKGIDKTNQSAQAGAQNALNEINGIRPDSSGHWQISEEQLEVAKKKESALQSAVDAQQAKVAGEHQDMRSDPLARWVKGTTAEGTKGDEEQLAQLKDTMDKLHEGIRATYGREQLEQLTIIAKKISVNTSPPVAVSGDGHTPATGL